MKIPVAKSFIGAQIFMLALKVFYIVKWSWWIIFAPAIIGIFIIMIFAIAFIWLSFKYYVINRW